MLCRVLLMIAVIVFFHTLHCARQMYFCYPSTNWGVLKLYLHPTDESGVNRLLIRLLTFTYLVLVSAQISALIRSVNTQTHPDQTEVVAKI